MFASMKTKLVATALLAGLAAPATAADLASAAVYDFAPSKLVVKSNGQFYTQLYAIGMTNVGIRFEYDVGVAGRVKSWKVWPHIKTGYGSEASLGNLSAYSYSKSYSVGNRPKKVSRHVNVDVPAHLYESRAVSMCNQLASNLRAYGLSNNEIFSQHREVKFLASAQFEVDASGAGSSNPIVEYQPPREIKVRCAKWKGSRIPQAGNNTLQNPLHVLKSTMKLQELALLNGTCAVKLTTAISTNTAGATIKYRFQHSSGKKSKVFTTKTAANKIAVVTHTWDVPNKPGQERGTMQLVGVNHNFQSNAARYSMACKDAPGGFAPTPKKPKVAIPLGGRGKLLN